MDYSLGNQHWRLQRSAELAATVVYLVYIDVGVSWCVWRSDDNLRESSPSALWVLVTEFGLPSLAASNFAQ